MSKCKNCKNNCEGEYCFRHKPRKALPKIGKKKAWKIEVEEAIDNINKMSEFFLSIWKKRPHISEISGETLFQDFDGYPSSTYFHHILPKNKYDFAKYDEENIILLTPEEHEKVESDMYFYEEINKRREKLKEKYKIS